VADLLAVLEQSGVPCPGWLARLLVVAGHVLPEGPRLAGPLKSLNRVNGACRGGEKGLDVELLLAGMYEDASVDGDIAGALVARLMELGRSEDAARLALAHGHRAPGALRNAKEPIDALAQELPRTRLRLAGYSTTEALAEALHPAFVAAGWRPEISRAGFGEVIAELMGPQHPCDALVVLLDFDGLASLDWRNAPARVAELFSERADLLASAMAKFAEQSAATLLINTIPCAPAPMAGLLDRRHAMGLRRAIDFVNARILQVAEQSARVVVIDSDLALADIPLSDHIEPKLWFYGRVAYSLDATRALAHAFAQAWRLLRHGPLKVLALDLDNTLWGGTFGEDGVERLLCGHDFPGNAFLAMQQECLRLRNQGLLLVALSKNNAEAVTAFDQHPGMTMRSHDFAATAVNWVPKPQNIRKLAADLNLGLDSFMFLDDSPQERDAMRRLCPEVSVPEMPADPAERPLWLRRLSSTWPVRLTDEDQARQALYVAGREVGRWKAAAATHEDFLRGLEQRLTVARIGRNTVARVAQMHLRTNQFNLTTVRSTEADIAAMAADDWPGVGLHGRVSDRFGDHGIVVAAVAAIEGSEASIRSFLMSCRVIGREIERAFLGELLRELARRGADRVYGAYLPTAKNAIVRDFYSACGFTRIEEDEGRSTWLLHLDRDELPGSQFVSIEWEA
jgi:FkbH-like protein